MSEYLFVAEADKIQDLLFRSSKRREVAGGSQMLTEFCKDVALQLTPIPRFKGRTVISAGGSFRICFDSKEKAKEFGECLSELYRRKMDGTITIAKPVEVTTGKEDEAIKNAQKYLRKAKHSGKNPISVEQMPYIAICASCGIGIARYYEKQFKDDKNPKYLCEVCYNKTESWRVIKTSFLSRFVSRISEGMSEELKFEDVDKIAELEQRNYIAYLIADANSMGTVFSKCSSFEELKQLSEALDNVIQDSLAEPTKVLIKNQRKLRVEGFSPVLPLILGGDDVFAVIPAQWALDFAQRFAREFQERMERSLKDIGIQNDMPPTISAAVIICKGKFPYSVAYERGEELLKIAKKRAKNEKASTISFELIKGNELVESTEDKEIVAGFPAYTLEELEKLIEYRFKLIELPGTRRAQLEDLFLRAETIHNKEMMYEWRIERGHILNRLKDESLRGVVDEAMRELGDSTDEYNWIWIKDIRHHKLPDLLVAWDYAYNLEEDLLEYGGKNETDL